MIYRFALVADFPAIADYVHSRDYFMPIDPSTLGGTWLLAEKDGIVQGVIWFFAGGGNAYIDYWAANSARVAARLAICAESTMREMGVKHVRGMIGAQNLAARRLADGLGMVSGGEYTLAYKRM